MYCPNCGTQNAEGVQFCKSCGKPLAKASDLSAPAHTVSAQASTRPEPAKDTAQTASFVLAIIAIVLTFIPIPLVSWFAGPCAVVGFGLAFNVWKSCKRNGRDVPAKMILSLVFAGYAMLNILTHNVASDGGGLESIVRSILDFLQ